MRWRVIIFVNLLLILPFSLLSCRTMKAPTGCVQLQEEALRSLDFGHMSLADLEHWFDNSHFKGEKIEIVDYLDKSRKSATWIYKDINYVANFSDGVLVSVDVYWEKRGKVALEPISAQVINCFGSPDLYQALYLPHIDVNVLDLSLWYPDKGIVVSGIHTGKHWVDWPGRPPPSFDEKVTMTNMTMVAPGTIEEMIKDMYVNGDKADIREKVLKRLKSWPGAWEKIVVDTN